MSRSYVPVVAAMVGLAGCAAPPRSGGAGSASPPQTMISFAELAATLAPAADHCEAYGDGPQQFGELRLPRARGRVPVVVLIHGGCWRAQYDLTHVAPAAAALATAGYAVWVPEYRRVGNDGGGWPGTFDDIANAVDFVRVLASKYSLLDTTRVVLVGHSAGGQLAMWAASRRPGEAPGASSSKTPLRVSGVVSLAGITDLAAFAAPAGCGSAVVPLVGGRSTEMPDRYRSVSPVSRIPLGVPVRLVHGTADPSCRSRRAVTSRRARGPQAARRLSPKFLVPDISISSLRNPRPGARSSTR